jgi:hypothetical protein
LIRVQRGQLPKTSAQDAPSFIQSADAANTLFVATTLDGLRAQDIFGMSTSVE